MHKVFVTGTDTEVGKTFVSCALLEALRKQGLNTCAMKPIASGCETSSEGLRNEDALALMHFATHKLPYEQVNPFAFKEAIAPHVAAKLTQQAIDIPLLKNKTRQFLDVAADFHLIEGAGGWRVPVRQDEKQHYFFSDFAENFSLPVILVVAIRLGCINHALLSAEAIERSGLKLVGWVANRIGDEQDVVQQENILSIKTVLSAPLLAEIPEYKQLGQQAAIEQAAERFSQQSIKQILEGSRA